jgi:hypothetical protein
VAFFPEVAEQFKQESEFSREGDDSLNVFLLMGFLNISKLLVHVESIVETLGVSFSFFFVHLYSSLSLLGLLLGFSVIVVLPAGFNLLKFAFDELFFSIIFSFVESLDSLLLLVILATASFHAYLKLVFYGSSFSFILDFDYRTFLRAQKADIITLFHVSRCNQIRMEAEFFNILQDEESILDFSVSHQLLEVLVL